MSARAGGHSARGSLTACAQPALALVLSMPTAIDSIMDAILKENPAWFPYGLSRKQLDQTWLVRDPETKAPAGFTGWQFRPNDKGGTTGWYAVGLLPAFRGKGLAKKALKEMFSKKPAFVDDIKAFIVKGNEASVNLAKRLGVPYQHKSASAGLRRSEQGVTLSPHSMTKIARPSVVHMQQYMPLVGRRTRFTPQEQETIDANKSNWFPALFPSSADSPAVDMHSPGKAALMAGLLGGGAGLLGASALDASPQTKAVAGTGLGTLAAIVAYLKTRANNDSVEESMRRIPANGTRRDVESDPVYQANLDRLAQSGASTEALRTAQLMAAMNAVKSANALTEGIKALAGRAGRAGTTTAKFMAVPAIVATTVDRLNENSTPFWSLDHPARWKNWLTNALLMGAARVVPRAASKAKKKLPVGFMPTLPEGGMMLASLPTLYQKDFLRTNMNASDRVSDAIKYLADKNETAPSENWLQTAGKAMSEHPWLTGAVGLGGLGLLAMQSMKGERPVELHQQPKGGRIKVTLPTKKPGDMETSLDLPIDQISLSGAQMAKLRRDARRRLRAESEERTIRRVLPESERQRRAEFIRQFHA